MKTKSQDEMVAETILYVKQTLADAEQGHDWLHTWRVWKLAVKIARMENNENLVVSLGALLHDIADPKFHQYDEEAGIRKAEKFLSALGLPADQAEHVCQIVYNTSYRGGFPKSTFHSRELLIVQDADRLDAIGAIGIARAFHYGGFRNRPMHLPDQAPKNYSSAVEYYMSDSSTLNHFYEKLLLLYDRLNTPAAREIGMHKHQFMLEFLQEFLSEWNEE